MVINSANGYKFSKAAGSKHNINNFQVTWQNERANGCD